jgi:phosphoribosyl 1,2-cyclic phosphodiesterase
MEFRALASSSSGNCYLVSDGDSQILIEAGIHWKRVQQALDFKTSAIQFALISHAHNDHAGHVKSVLRSGIDCYMSEHTRAAHNLNGHRTHVIEPLKQFTVGPWTILPFTTMHDCPGSLGFLIAKGAEKLLFCTDSFYLKYKFKELNLIAIECNYSKSTLSPDINPEQKKRLLKSHFSLENVKTFLTKNDLSRVREIHLIHVSRDNGDADLFRREVEKLTGKPTFIAAA